MAGNPRKIIHVDMDAFYASVEQRDNAEYKGKPIVVGGSPDGRGVVATASYEARKFGIHSAMSSKRALQLCPHVVFVWPRFAVYKEVSQHIRSIFGRYTDLIEPLSLDEAYLDVTKDKLGIGSALEIAKQIKQAIREELNLTASAGVSVNKFVAKVASGMNKPDGLTFINPSSVERFMEQLPVEKFFGVGKVTADKMKKLGFHTGADLKTLTLDEIVDYFGKPGQFYYRVVRGIDDRDVQTERETKSVSAEDTFSYDLTDLAEIYTELDKIAKIVSDRLRKHNLKGRTLTLKIKYGDFKQITRNQSFDLLVDDAEIIVRTAKKLFESTIADKRPIRLLGIGLSNFNDVAPKHRVKEQEVQLKLF